MKTGKIFRAEITINSFRRRILLSVGTALVVGQDFDGREVHVAELTRDPLLADDVHVLLVGVPVILIGRVE